MNFHIIKKNKFGLDKIFPVVIFLSLCLLSFNEADAQTKRRKKSNIPQPVSTPVPNSNLIIPEIVSRADENEVQNPVSAQVARVFGRNNLIPARRLTSSKNETQEFQTVVGSHRIFAALQDKKNLGAINQNIFLAIRPEHISISFGASFPEDNLLKATVTNVKFFGHMTLIGLVAEGIELEAMVLRLVGLNVGDECVVGLPPDRILILKD